MKLLQSIEIVFGVVVVIVAVVVVVVFVVAVGDIKVYFSIGWDFVLIGIVIYLSPKELNTYFYIKSVFKLKLLVVDVPGYIILLA